MLAHWSVHCLWVLLSTEQASLGWHLNHWNGSLTIDSVCWLVTMAIACMVWVVSHQLVLIVAVSVAVAVLWLIEMRLVAALVASWVVGVLVEVGWCVDMSWMARASIASIDHIHAIDIG